MTQDDTPAVTSNVPPPPKSAVMLPVVRDPIAAMFKNTDTGKRRSCGTCTECCTVMRIDDLKPTPKEAFCDCPHQRKTRTSRKRAGCSIYADRPPSCRGYECYWLTGLFTQADRPDRLGMIVDSSDGALVGLTELAGFPVVTVRETRPGAHKSKRFKLAMEGLLQRVAILYHGDGYPYLMAAGTERMAKLQAASAKLDHWSLLTDAHRKGEHGAVGAGECPLCDMKCPAHADTVGFFPTCSICREALSLQLAAAEAKKGETDGGEAQ